MLVGVLVLAGGVLLGLYGLFALLYRDHGGGSTYVRLFGRRIDAHLVGGRVDVSGTAGNGTLVTIRVPLSAAEPKESDFQLHP